MSTDPVLTHDALDEMERQIAESISVPDDAKIFWFCHRCGLVEVNMKTMDIDCADCQGFLKKARNVLKDRNKEVV